MEHKIADYYDMPYDLLPSANFAACPSSEISENSFVEGLRTFMVSPSESESETEHTPGPTDRQRINASELPARWKSRPSNGVVAAEEKANSSDAGSVIGNKGSLERPRLREKVATAPPGTFSLQSFVPHPPRRAISAKLKPSRINNSRLLRESQNETDERLTKKSPWTRPKWLSNGDEKGTGTFPPRTRNTFPSLSAKARVQRTLRAKKLTDVKNSDVAVRSDKILSAPLSLMMTPSEMYGIPKDPVTTSTAREPVIRFPPFRSIEDESSLSMRQCSARNTLSLKRPQQYHWSETGTRLKVYLPGCIRIERHSMWLRRDSVAILDPFDKTSACESHANEADLDGIAAFFTDMGIVDKTTDKGQDRFWLRDNRDEHQHTRPRRHSISSLDESSSNIPQEWNDAPSPRGSRFSFSSGSSGAPNKSLSWRPIRQRIRLKRLLPPTLSGFHRIPAITEPHKDELSLV